MTEKEAELILKPLTKEQYHAQLIISKMYPWKDRLEKFLDSKEKFGVLECENEKQAYRISNALWYHKKKGLIRVNKRGNKVFLMKLKPKPEE